MAATLRHVRHRTEKSASGSKTHAVLPIHTELSISTAQVGGCQCDIRYQLQIFHNNNSENIFLFSIFSIIFFLPVANYRPAPFGQGRHIRALRYGLKSTWSEKCV